MMEKRIVGTGESMKILRNGRAVDPIDVKKAHPFPVGFRFLLQSFPYNSIFTVREIKKDSGVEYRRIDSIRGDDVYMDIKDLHFAMQNGDASALPDEPTAPILAPTAVKVKKAKKSSAKKPAKKAKNAKR